jgi:hypothetical protein
VAAADLGQADKFGLAHHHLVRRKSAIAGRQQQPRKAVISRLERSDVGASLLDLDAARSEYAESDEAHGQVLAEPTIGSSQVVAQQWMRYGQTDCATQHAVSIDEDSAATGATMQNFDTRGHATRTIHNFRHAAPQPEPDNDGRRPGDVPALQLRPTWLDLVQQRFVTRERFPRLLGW